jgi:VanZ family protein
MDRSAGLKFLRFWFPVILYSGIIFYVSAQPHLKVPLPGLQFDKAVHLLEYVPFGFLLARGIYRTKPSVCGKNLLGLVILFSCAYGVSDEFHQSFVPGRFAALGDVMMDTAGGLIGGYLYSSFIIKHAR